MTNIAQATPRLTLRSPADLIAATPYLLGFHPARSVVVVGFAGRQVTFAARSDLPDPGEPPADTALEVLDIVARQHVDAVALIGYGPAAEVRPVLGELIGDADRRGILVRDALRVDGDRWWSYLCTDPTCCPPEGIPVDLTSSEVSAVCTMEGLAATPSREDLARQVASIDGLARISMTQATGRAKRRYARLLAGCAAGEWAQAVLAEGTAAVRAAVGRYEDGGVLDDDELAWLSLLLDVIAVRDVAWQAIAGTAPERRLWTDVTRRADPALIAAPACLLAFAAWRAGDGVLAGLALERALRSDPAYSMAHLLIRGLRRGLPPSALVGWPVLASLGSPPLGPSPAASPPAVSTSIAEPHRTTARSNRRRRKRSGRRSRRRLARCRSPHGRSRSCG